MHSQGISKIYYSLTHWHDFRLKLFGEGILIGLFVGIIIVLFRLLLEQVEEIRDTIFLYFQSGHMLMTVVLFLGLIGIAKLLAYLVKVEPMSAGSGIPQVKGTILGLMKMKWLNVLICKFIGGVVAIGAGLSLGREGPSIQLGATIGQGLSRSLSRTKIEESYLITSGASAGLAAAFNAPLAGVIFSLEELHKNFSPTVLMSTVAAALTASLVSQYFFGINPIFNFTGLPILPIRYYWYIIILGIIIGFLGFAFNRILIITLNAYENQRTFTATEKAALPLIIAGILGFVLPQVLGGGNNLINELATTSFSLTILIILLITKFFFTMLSYGSGVPGGIFLPMLVIGALSGSVFSHIAIQYGLLESAYGINLIVLSMAAYFSAVVKAPITGSILIMEMTGSFSHMLPLIVVSMTSYLVADVLKSKPIYEELLERSLSKQKKTFINVTTQKRVLLEVVVCKGSKLDGTQLKKIDWPPYSLVVSIKRGETELVPKGDTRIIAGDFLYVLTNVNQVKPTKDLANLCNITKH